VFLDRKCSSPTVQSIPRRTRGKNSVATGDSSTMMRPSGPRESSQHARKCRTVALSLTTCSGGEGKAFNHSTTGFGNPGSAIKRKVDPTVSPGMVQAFISALPEMPGRITSVYDVAALITSRRLAGALDAASKLIIIT
jgi:hypothetical protein